MANIVIYISSVLFLSALLVQSEAENQLGWKLLDNLNGSEEISDLAEVKSENDDWLALLLEKKSNDLVANPKIHAKKLTKVKKEFEDQLVLAEKYENDLETLRNLISQQQKPKYKRPSIYYPRLVKQN